MDAIDHKRIRIEDLMRHSAGLAWFIDPKSKVGTAEEKYTALTLKDVLDREPMHRIIEQSPPQIVGQSPQTYHGLTRGWVVDGLLKRVDPKKRTIGQFLREEFLVPLGLSDDYFVALPQDARRDDALRR